MIIQKDPQQKNAELVVKSAQKGFKTLSIGDIHGIDYWKKLVSDKYDKIIFLGDYVDSFKISDKNIYKNFLEIIEYKKSNPDKVILLFGNHDLQYLYSYSIHGCSGFRPQMYSYLHITYQENKDLFQVAYQHENTLWTHAGVTNKWYEKFLSICTEGNEDLFLNYGDDIASQLDWCFKTRHSWLLSLVHSIRGGMRGDPGGPFWADKSETEVDMLHGIDQIVGHTRVKSIESVTLDGSTIYYCDCLEYGKQEGLEL